MSRITVGAKMKSPPGISTLITETCTALLGVSFILSLARYFVAMT